MIADEATKVLARQRALHGDRLSRQDVLSAVLDLIRLRGESIEVHETGENKSIAFDGGRARFHFVEHGAFRLNTATSDAAFLAAGDLVLLPRGCAHILTTVDTPESPLDSLPASAHLHRFASGPFRLLTGSFQFESVSVGPLVAGLPNVIHLRAEASGAPEWQRAILRFVRLEASEPAPGAALMISRLIDLLVIRSLREWATTRPAHSGWLRGLGDVRLGRALAAMHGEPAREWTLGELAKIAAMSRSHFAERFTKVVGEPPLRYLARWRLGLAADLLRNRHVRVGEAASVAGYRSDASFSRAFKACFGHSPRAARDGGDSH